MEPMSGGIVVGGLVFVEMRAEVQDLVKAVYRDAVKTWPSLTLDWLFTEAERQLRGDRPMGGPGVFLHEYLVKAGFVTKC